MDHREDSIAKKLKPVHPGEILREQFMKPVELSMNKLALQLRVPVTRIAEICHERRGITTHTALRLGRYFNTSAVFWINLQWRYELDLPKLRNPRRLPAKSSPWNPRPPVKQLVAPTAPSQVKRSIALPHPPRGRSSGAAVGCGGGRTIEKLAALAPQGAVDGVDYATGSVAASRHKNKKLLTEGRVAISHASVSHLPFADNTFDLVTAVETQYYWPDLPHDMREVLRVLKPGGTLLVLAESYKKGSHEFIQRPVIKLLGSSNLSVEDQRALFTSADYAAVEIFELRKKSWLCATGKKPPAT